MKIMNDNDFKAFIADNSWELNKKTIEDMMEKELKKEPEDIDLDFVDACLNCLTGYGNEETSNSKGKVIKGKRYTRIKLTKVIIAAVIVVLSVSVGITAYAKANDMQISDIFVSIFENKVIIRYSDKELLERYSNNLDGNPLYNQLEENGIENIMLPFDLYYMDYEIVSNDSSAGEQTLVINFEDNTEVKIIEYKEETNIQNLEINGTFTSSKKININNTDIYLFERQNTDSVETLVSYQIDKTQYLIVVNNDILSAENFVTKNRR